MSQRLNTFVDFRGDFPKPDPREAIPGEEVTALLTAGLAQRGFPAHGVEAADFERIIDCSSGDVLFQIRVWIDSLEMDRWEVSCPATVSCLGWLLGYSDHREHRQLLEAIDDVLHQASGVRDVRWFPGYEMPEIRDRCSWDLGPVVGGEPRRVS